VTRLALYEAIRDSLLRCFASVRLSLIARALKSLMRSEARTRNHEAKELASSRVENQLVNVLTFDDRH